MLDETGSEGRYTLVVAARLTGLSPARVRHYVRIGLVVPAGVERGRPVFGERAVARLRRIRRLGQDLGVNVAGIEVALRLLDQLVELQSAFDRRNATG